MNSYDSLRVIIYFLILLVCYDADAELLDPGREGLKGKNSLDVTVFLLTSITAIVSSIYILLGTAVACQWPYPTCWCYSFPGSDRAKGRCCSLYQANCALAAVWLLLGAISAISRNISRLAVCLGYMLAHSLVVTFLRYKFSRFGAPVSDGVNGSMVIPLEQYDERARAPRSSGALSPSFFTPLERSPAGAPSEAAHAIGLPAFSLPMFYAVVGRCPADCTCPYCCLAAAGAAAPITTLTAVPDDPDPIRITQTCSWQCGLTLSDRRFDELYLPGALLPEASSAANDGGAGPAMVQRPLPRSNSDLAPALLLPSARARLPSRRANPDDSSSSFQDELLLAAGLAVGLPVPTDLLLVDGVPVADALRLRRGIARRAVGGGVGGSSTQDGFTGPGSAAGLGPGPAPAELGLERLRFHEATAGAAPGLGTGGQDGEAVGEFRGATVGSPRPGAAPARRSGDGGGITAGEVQSAVRGGLPPESPPAAAVIAAPVCTSLL